MYSLAKAKMFSFCKAKRKEKKCKIALDYLERCMKVPSTVCRTANSNGGVSRYTENSLCILSQLLIITQ